jgi:hypothetical protein
LAVTPCCTHTIPQVRHLTGAVQLGKDLRADADQGTMRGEMFAGKNHAFTLEG